MKSRAVNYSFKEITHCNMCHSKTNKNEVLGIRLNQSQGLFPRRIKGVKNPIHKCSNCNLIYPNPIPIPEDLQDHYGVPPKDYWNEIYFKIDPNYFNTQIYQAKSIINFKKGMAALDIGAGIGKGMIALNNAGFDTYGLEPSVTFRQKALQNMNISDDRLKFGSIEDTNYDLEEFDFISFGAVFEHLYDPNTALKKALSWLKKDGVIHIEVPSSKYLITRLFNLYYSLIGTDYVSNLSPMHEPYHIYEFGLESFQKNGKINQYEIFKYYYDNGSIYHVPKIFHPYLNKSMKKNETGMQLTIWLKKKS